MRARILALVGEGRPRRGDGHLPLALRAGAAARRRGHRHRPALRHLRHGRPDGDDEAGPARPRAGRHERAASRQALLGQIGRWKNDLIGPEAADDRGPRLPRGDRRTGLRGATRRASSEPSALDFDDLLNEAVRLFEQAPGVLAHYQDRWRYLHVDEYQDTNRAQYLWVRAARRQAQEPGRGRRRRPEHLLVARRRPAQHPRLRARLPRRHRRQAGAELPLDAADPRRRPRGRVAATRRARTRSSGRRTRAACSSSASRPTRRTRRPSGSRARWRRSSAAAARAARSWRAAPTRATSAATGCATSRSCTAPTRRAERSRKRSCATACATSWSAARASTSAARSRTRWPTCAFCAATATRRPSSGSSTCPPRGIGEKTIALCCARPPAAAAATSGRR